MSAVTLRAVRGGQTLSGGRIAELLGKSGLRRSPEGAARSMRSNERTWVAPFNSPIFIS